MDYNTAFVETCRKFGEQRLDIAAKAKTKEDWQALWTGPAHPYPFTWGPCWKMCIEYRVDDYPAEIGFFLDILGLDSNALGADFAMLMNSEQEFTFAVKPAGAEGSTPPNAIRLQFMLNDLLQTAEELEKRGIVFEVFPQPSEPGSPLYTGMFRTPHGIAVDLWGMVSESPAPSSIE